MNILCITLTFLLVMSVTDFVRIGGRMHRQLYEITFFITYFIFTIKYYYGPDITYYSPAYDEIPSILEIIKGEPVNSIFEIGYTAIEILSKSLGVPFWGFTALISTFYFITLHKLLNELTEYKIVALSTIVILDFTLIAVSLRQCVSVSFFILMYLAYKKGDNVLSLLYLILTSLCHKSGIFIGGLTFLFLQTRGFRLNRQTYVVLFIMMLMLMFIPFQHLLEPVMKITLSASNTVHSLQYHLSGSRMFQSVLLLYVIYFTIFICYPPTDERSKNANKITLIGLTLIAILYQFYPILWRIRQYFTPFLVIYILTVLTNIKNRNTEQYTATPGRYTRLIYQTIFIALLVFNTYTVFAAHKSQNRLRHKVYDTCTIFDAIRGDRNQIRQRQLDKAWLYWEEDMNL